MIELKVKENDSLEVIQRDVRPSVYFDHWAFMEISSNAQLKKKFIEILKSRKGTLCVSWLNLTEFSKVDVKQKRFGEDFLNEIIPNLVFIECAPFVVIDRENDFMNGGPKQATHIDAELGKLLLFDDSTLLPLSASNILAYVANSRLDERVDAVVRVIIDKTEQMRIQMFNDAEFAKQVKNFVFRELGVFQHGTRHLIREMLRSFLLNPLLKLTKNHAIDLLHTVVPVAYCEFVLLDKHWMTQVEVTKKRFNDLNITGFTLARVYSKSNDGIERFLNDLESYE